MPLIYFHIGTLILTACVIIYTDHQAFQYLTGKKQLLDKKLMTRLHYLVWAGLLGMIVTGFLMAWPGREYYFTLPGFLIKMGFVGILFVNAIVIGYLMPIASQKPFAELTKGEKLKLFLSGAASTVGWVGAATAALLVL